MEDLRKRANDLLVYYGKMQSRLVQAGVNDTSSLVTLFSDLQRGLEAINIDEVEPAIQEVTRLVESLRKMQADLQVLKELKTRMAGLTSGVVDLPPAENSGDSPRHAA